MERTQFPSEEEQYRLYRRVVERMGGRTVTLRTLDIGNDKQLSYFKTPKENNPALGWRGLRISIEWQDLLRVQLRAALRASAHGPMRILLPMVTSIEEVREVHRIFDGVRRQLADQGFEIPVDVPVGIMVEVPSTVLVLPHIIGEVDFVSVGTNDLVQYLLAVDRDNPWVSKLYDVHHPAVLAGARPGGAGRARRRQAVRGVRRDGRRLRDRADAHGHGLRRGERRADAPGRGQVRGARIDARRSGRDRDGCAWPSRRREGVRRVLAQARDRLHSQAVGEPRRRRADARIGLEW